MSDLERKNPCPECDGAGTITEVRRYTSPPPGDSVWATNTKRAYPPLDPNAAVVEVSQRRVCCRCGGTGEKRQ